ncbi:MAG: glycosyltransferase family 1 protein [Pseudomonadota bacterium]
MRPEPFKVLIATDAWHPQINGVVRTFERVCEYAPHYNVEIDVLHPGEWRTVPLPTYNEIRLALCTYGSVRDRIEASNPDYIHIATEGPVGFRTRQNCLRTGRGFTTSYHTKFPEYLNARIPVPVDWTYKRLCDFHNAGQAIMVTNDSLKRELSARGFENIRLWSRGVDCEVFHPIENSVLDLPRPIFLYVGRVSVEKNIEAFLKLDLPGTKVVTGKGPQLADLQSKYPDVHFTGAKEGEELTEIYASSDVFVFPSKTDTFGIVLLEALACGTPVAAYPVTGPRDVVGGTGCGALSDDLRQAALDALEIPRERCRAYAKEQSWLRSIGDFMNNILGVNDEPEFDLDEIERAASAEKRDFSSG